MATFGATRLLRSPTWPLPRSQTSREARYWFRRGCKHARGGLTAKIDQGVIDSWNRTFAGPFKFTLLEMTEIVSRGIPDVTDIDVYGLDPVGDQYFASAFRHAKDARYQVTADAAEISVRPP